MARVRSYVTHQPVFVRSIHAESLLEDFFVFAVGAVLGIRLYLAVTGYPQLTIGPLHIAHLVWGGLFMLVAVVILLASLSYRGQTVAAVVGGIGFGAFIDEVGKFITRDNDYFFRPAVAVIYAVFVVIFVATRFIGRRRALTPQQNLANAFDIAKQGSLSGLHPEQRDQALEMLAECPPGPVRDNMESILRSMSLSRTPRVRLMEKAHDLADRLYATAAFRGWLSAIVVAFFALTSVTSLYAVVGVVTWSLGTGLWVGAGIILLVALISSVRGKRRYLNIASSAGIVAVSILISWALLGHLKRTPLSVADYAQFVFPSVTGVLVIIGMLTLPRSRLRAYAMFRLAILVSIFLTQVFSFYRQQFVALVGLVMDVIILVALRYLVSHEHERAGTEAQADSLPLAPR
jgi:hypothetical protein